MLYMKVRAELATWFLCRITVPELNFGSLLDLLLRMECEKSTPLQQTAASLSSDGIELAAVIFIPLKQ